MKDKPIALESLGQIRQGLTITRYMDPKGSKRALLQVANLEGGVVHVTDTTRRELVDVQRTADHLAHPHQVLISLRGSVLKAAVVPENFEDEEAVISSSLVSFEPDLNRADPTFLAGLLSSQAMQARVAPLFTGVAIQGIPVGQFKKLEIQLPSLDIQKACAEAVRTLDQYERQVTAVIGLHTQILNAHFDGFVARERN